MHTNGGGPLVCKHWRHGKWIAGMINLWFGKFTLKIVQAIRAVHSPEDTWKAGGGGDGLWQHSHQWRHDPGTGDCDDLCPWHWVDSRYLAEYCLEYYAQLPKHEMNSMWFPTTSMYQRISWPSYFANQGWMLIVLKPQAKLLKHSVNF